jgi:DNA-binding SARP family transcriptional activator/tetratricopeptide (TPR) repeat protein
VGPELRLLGPVEVWVGGDRVDIGGPKQRSVLAALAAEANQSVTTGALIDRVWGDASPATPSTLYSYIKRLRDDLSAVPEIRIERVSGGYVLDIDRDRVDLHRFRELTRAAAGARDDHERAAALWSQALSLWRGTALDGLSGAWFDRLRDALDRERLAASIESNEVELLRGRHVPLLSELRRLADEHPLDERIAGQLLLAAYRSGRQAEGIERYHLTRTRLAEQLGVRPSSELEGLYLRILRRDNELAPPSPGRPIPAQVPHDIDGFIGREAELDQLSEQLTGGGGMICAVEGLGGVGKTALAIRFAHRAAGHFPDGQLYVDMRGFGPNLPPLAADAAIGGFLRALHVDPQRIPTDHAELAALYRSVLSGRRMLILLDNVAAPDQVRPLLPGTPGNHVLITSRSRLAGLAVRDGARRITLGALPPPDAVKLLAHVVGSERVAAQRQAADHLARKCGYLPLALRVAADRVAARPRPNLSELADELTEERDRLDVLTPQGDDTAAVRAVFSWSYRSLPPDQARMFRLLGLHAGEEISDAAAAALAGVTPSAARSLLDGLTGVHLIEESQRGRRRLHDLIRLYAAERAAEEETEQDRTKAVQRSLTWYLHTADAAGRVLLPVRRRGHLAPLEPGCEPLTFTEARTALAWCEVERGNLVAATHQAAEYGLHAIAWQLPVALWDFFYLRSHWADWIATHERGLVAARQDGDRMGEAGVLLSLGHAYEQVGRFAGALDTEAASLVIWRELDDKWGEGVTLHILAGVYKGLRRFPESIEHYQRALPLHYEIGNMWGVGWTLTNLGAAYRELGQLDFALDVTREASSVLQQLGDRQGESRAVNDLADIHLALGRADEALHCYRRALQVNREIASRRGEAWSHHGIGDALHNMGQFDAARESWLSALRIFEELGDDSRVTDVRARLRDSS